MSHFSLSTTCSSPTASTSISSPPYSPGPPTSSTLSPPSSLSATSANQRLHARWAPLSEHGLPRSSSTSARSHRFASPATTPSPSPSPSPSPPIPDTAHSQRQPSPAPRREPAPTMPHAASSSPPSSQAADEKGRADETALRRLGRSVGRGLRRCSSCFRRRPMGPEEVEEVPGPRHWSEY
ncbi:hypothetical protein GTA08_BOTSDO10387 [Neofusicoccum parvum]|uniref:Uncharacterized protein n=1 Tax=Neofusicoccum parvum TaxID=310453 RepID=A0ACB5RTI2_9PEZI|nr:hypothetical protein GTA08_BOTSDO10387 [Neofusicoccum parvum]